MHVSLVNIELSSVYYIHGPDCRLIASTEVNNDDLLLDWSLYSMQFAICKFFAGLYVLRTRFENFYVFLVW